MKLLAQIPRISHNQGMEQNIDMEEKFAENLSAEQITQIGNPRKPTGEAGAVMLERMNESHKDVTEWALSLMPIADADSVLDIGCGGGACLKAMFAKNNSANFCGIDYSEVSVATAGRTCAQEIASGKIKIIHVDVEALPFADESFDKIITVESFYFWGNKARALQEVLRALKTGGVFFLVADIFGRADLSEKAKENIARYDMFNPTPDEFKALMRDAGFARTTININGDWICVASEK